MANYRYLVTDVLTGAVTAELPLSGVSFGRQLNGSGQASGTLKLSDPRVQRAFSETGTQPGRSALYVLYNGDPLWGGVIWSRKYAVKDETIALGATEWFSALMRRKVRADLTWTAETPLETVVGDVVAHAQTETNGAFGMTVAGTTGIVAQGRIARTDHKWAGDAITDLLKAAGGVDYQVDAEYSGTALVPTLRLGHPSLGRTLAACNLTVAEALEGSWDEDASKWATHAYVYTTTATGYSSLTEELVNTTSLAGGYPRWDTELSSDAKTKEKLQDDAARHLTARTPLGALTSVKVRGGDPGVDQLELGDTVRIAFSPNARFQHGLVSDARITGWTLQPEGDQLSLTLAEGDDNG